MNATSMGRKSQSWTSSFVVTTTTKLHLWRTAQIGWKERFDEDLPTMTPFVCMCKGKEQLLWSQGLLTNGIELSTIKKFFPSALLDDIMVELPNKGGTAIARTMKSATHTIICTIPLQASRFKWANGILQGESSKELSQPH